MSEARPRLSYARLGELPARYRPSIDPAARDIRVVHLGIGAFHRAHQAVYTENSGDWGICGVTERAPTVRDQLAPQDGLYTLVARGHDSTSFQVIGAVRQVLFAGDDPDAIARRLADPTVSVVTTTVTEKGYRADPGGRRLLIGDAEVAADLAGRPPRTVVGQLARGIAARAANDAPPLTVVCCDNMPSNGVLLGSLVEEFLTRAQVAPGSADWLAENVSFPSTMVDRIAPATTAADRELVAIELGVDDLGAVVAESFSQWVIEDRFSAPRPAWDSAGALLVDDVGPYEQLKLRLLNGSHSALAYLGGLAGYSTIAEAIADGDLAAFVRRLMRDDVAPTLSAPRGIDLDEYQGSVLERFANATLGHRTRQVAMDGSQKLPQRLLPAIRGRRAAGAEPAFATLVVAAWMRHIVVGADDAGRPFEPDDPLLEALRARVPASAASLRVVDALLGVHDVFGDLGDDGWFRRTLARDLDELARHGALSVVRGIAGAGA